MNSPHALQMLFPASSRRQRGVVLVLQFAQLRAPTGARPRADRPGEAPLPPGPLVVPALFEEATTAEVDACNPGSEDVLAWGAPASGVAGSCGASTAFSRSRRALAERALL